MFALNLFWTWGSRLVIVRGAVCLADSLVLRADLEAQPVLLATLATSAQVCEDD